MVSEIAFDLSFHGRLQDEMSSISQVLMRRSLKWPFSISVDSNTVKPSHPTMLDPWLNPKAPKPLNTKL